MGFKGTLLGGAFGWALGGPIGAVVGGLLGDRAGGGKKREGANAAVSLAVLLAAVTKAGGKGEREAGAGVRSVLADTFGPENADDLMRVYRRAFGMELDMEAIGAQLREALDGAGRLELLHVLFRIVAPAGPSAPETAAVREAGAALGIPEEEVHGVQARYCIHWARDLLGVSPKDRPEAIKKRYRDLAMKYHPDRVAHLGDAGRASEAEEKFKALREAYEMIERASGA